MLYIASSLSNGNRVSELRDKFAKLGVVLTYDWSTHGKIDNYNALERVAEQELEGVRKAKCMLVVMPGERGTHFEMGVAYTLEIPIVLLIENLDNHVWTSFHTLPRIEKCYNERDAIIAVMKLIGTQVTCVPAYTPTE